VDQDDLTPDPDVQAFLEANWRAAMASARETMERLRNITPELDVHMPETSANYIRSALVDAQDSYRSLHYAGPHVLGEDGYHEYLEAQTSLKLES
jgi:hypothetical protein